MMPPDVNSPNILPILRDHPRPAPSNPRRDRWRGSVPAGLGRRIRHGGAIDSPAAAFSSLFVAAPGAGEMARQAAAVDQHHVESHRQRGQVGAGRAGRPRRRGRCGGAGAGRATARPRPRDRARALTSMIASVAAAPRDDVDLARRAAPAAREDAPAAQPQMPAAQQFGEPAAAPRRAMMRRVLRAALSHGRSRLLQRERAAIDRVAARQPGLVGEPRHGVAQAASGEHRASRRSMSASSARRRIGRPGGPTTMTTSPRGGPASR